MGPTSSPITPAPFGPPGPGWYLGDPGQTCDEACGMYSDHDCSALRTDKVTSTPIMNHVVNNFQNSPPITCSIIRELQESFNPYISGADRCYYQVGTTYCDSSGTDIRRICCCALIKEDCTLI